jgi:Fe-S-cluster-containing dehydrogenase component/CRP-like cAMP-binding protein
MSEPERAANLPAEFFSIGEADEQLNSDELARLSLFEGLRKIPAFYRLPGSTILRKCQRGRVMCRQNEAGASAFYILTTQDVISLRQQQVELLEGIIASAPQAEGNRPQKFQGKSTDELRKIKSTFEQEIGILAARKATLEIEQNEAVKDQILNVAKVKLRVAPENDRPKRRGLLNRISGWFKRPAKSQSGPALIHVDSNIPLDGNTLEASLYEADVFGEMSCLNSAPRSATVTTTQDCYMLEFLRNVLNRLYDNPEYKEKNDEIYRKRVLDKQVRQLSVFKDLTEVEFNDLRPKLELKEFKAGAIIFDEHEDSDCLYLVRGGLVKVVKYSSALISTAEMGRISWKAFADELITGSQDASTVAGLIWSRLPTEIQTHVLQSRSSEIETATKERIGIALNDFIRSGSLLVAFGDRKSIILNRLNSPLIQDAIGGYPEKAKSWSESRNRVFHRALLEVACPGGIPKRESHRERTLNYLSKGEILGEIGMLTGQPRSATCLAFDQHDRGHEQSSTDLDANPSRVELVKLKKSDLAAISPQFRRNLEAAKDRRVASLKENVSIQSTGVQSLQSQTPEFEQLGLIQGQKLMLIDLEKCTRCNACVEACIDSHDDGRNRLYLDGPRFDKYLVPVTCRSCLDPVCLIGCPVGAIYRGDNGEINIRNHCIGCQTCTTQCPYGSIHKSVREEPTAETSPSAVQLEPGVVIREFTEKAVVCDMCNSTASRSPACVYSCPHDAAIRVDAREFFGVTDF